MNVAATFWHCERCAWHGTRDQCGNNPRLGYLRCPACMKEGLDCVVSREDDDDDREPIQPGDYRYYDREPRNGE
jgi:hypothetical protein